MREVSSDSITKTVKALVIQANKILPEDLVHCISCCEKTEQKDTARAVLSDLQANIDAAAQLDIPVCQDTGMAVIFAEIGQDVHISGENFEDAVNRGVAEGYTDGLLRKSVVRDPFLIVLTQTTIPLLFYIPVLCRAIRSASPLHPKVLEARI